jgi:hypothetical protein
MDVDVMPASGSLRDRPRTHRGRHGGSNVRAPRATLRRSRERDDQHQGLEATKLVRDSRAAAVDRIEEIQKKEKIDCDFRRLDGYLFQGRDMSAKIIETELDAVRELTSAQHEMPVRPQA